MSKFGRLVDLDMLTCMGDPSFSDKPSISPVEINVEAMSNLANASVSIGSAKWFFSSNKAKLRSEVSEGSRGYLYEVLVIPMPRTFCRKSPAKNGFFSSEATGFKLICCSPAPKIPVGSSWFMASTGVRFPFYTVEVGGKLDYPTAKAKKQEGL